MTDIYIRGVRSILKNGDEYIARLDVSIDGADFDNLTFTFNSYFLMEDIIDDKKFKYDGRKRIIRRFN